MLLMADAVDGGEGTQESEVAHDIQRIVLKVEREEKLKKAAAAAAAASQFHLRRVNLISSLFVLN